MPARKYEKKLHIDMPFDEALQRYAKTDPAEVQELIARKPKKTAGSKPPAAERPSPANRKRQS
jgi:ribosomal 50S subunit-associated protein YjgA (DUF615 family)